MWEERIYPMKELSTLGLGVTLTDLLNLISGIDASYPYLISIEPKEWCTNHVWCCSGRGVPFVVTKLCGWSKSQKLPPKADNTFDGHHPQKCLFVGKEQIQACKQFFLFGAEGPIRIHSLQATWAVFETCSHIEERCAPLMPYKPWLKARVYR